MSIKDKYLIVFLAFILKCFVLNSQAQLLLDTPQPSYSDGNPDDIINGVYEPGDYTNPGNCTTIKAAEGDPAATLVVQLLTEIPDTTISTVYIMGSQY